MVCGMGGSAIGADLAAAALGDRLTRPLLTVRGYGLPSWATPEWTVLCSSYSGGTEETLACFEAAEALGARRIVASTGGPLVDQAREAGVPVSACRGSSSPAPPSPTCSRSPPRWPRWPAPRPRVHTEIDAAAAFLERADRGAAGAAPPRSPPSSTAPRPVVYGADLTARSRVAGRRQVNENAKLPAFYSELPEADHNELCGWDERAAEHRLAAVFLEDSRPAPAGAPPLRADRRGRGRRRRAPRSGSRPPARPASPACSGRRCWATWSRWSWPRRAGSTRSRSRRSSASRQAMGPA